MAWNLNNNDNEYKLFNDQTEEIIQIYGLSVKYIKANSQNLDEIFGEYSHKKLIHDNVYDNFAVMPENADTYETLGNMFSKFGYVHTETFNFYVSSRTSDTLEYEEFRLNAVGDIILLPNNKKFEITDVEWNVEGTNNMFPYSNKKNVYLCKAKIWNYNGDEQEAPIVTVDEVSGEESVEDKLEGFNFTELDNLFNIEDDEVTPEFEVQVPERKVQQKKESKKIDIKKPSVFGDWD